jgi:hypothetical protein
MAVLGGHAAPFPPLSEGGIKIDQNDPFPDQFSSHCGHK